MRQKLFAAAALLVMAASAGAQEIVIDYRYNTAREDAGNYLSVKTANHFIAIDKDRFDAASGASLKGSTKLFGPLQVDLEGNATFPEGLRGLLLFPVAPPATRLDAGFRASKALNGEITLEFVNWGVAYRLVTDKQGKLTLPRGNFLMRTIGYVEGYTTQVISRDFSADGSVASIDWKKVWNPQTPSDRPIGTARTGAIQNDAGSLRAMFNLDGVLTVSLEKDVLSVSGKLKVARR